MELIVTRTLWIPLEEIIEKNKLTKNSLDTEIMDAIEDYVSEFDYFEYDLVGDDERKQIKQNLKKLLTK